RRGSALLLVVGLLTILAMLGGTFLVISYTQARTSESLTVKNRAEIVSRGVVERVGELLAADLHFSDTGADHWPYEDVGSDADAWRRFVDCATDETHDADQQIDPFLSHLANDTGSSQRRLSDVFGTSSTEVDTDGSLDSDGDPLPDAYLVDSGVSDDAGRRYYVAVNVVDLSALLNVNIHCRNDTTDGDLPSYVAPVQVDLAGADFISDAVGGEYDDINTARSGSATTPPLDIHENIALRPLNPDDADYLPFAISDETVCRWLAGGASTQTGRLWDAISGVGSGDRALLTTYNGSRVLVRRPDPTGADPLLRRLTLADIRDHGSTGACDRLFDELVAAGAPAAAAAHFAANLWAWLSDYDTTRDFALRYDSDGNGSNDAVAYGLIAGPVITEGYATHEPDFNGDGVMGDYYWGAAVEVYNPTSRQVRLDDYEIEGQALSGENIELPAGARCVLYNWDTEASVTADASDIFGESPGTNWYRVNGMTDFAESTKRLVRDVGGTSVPVDSVSAAELGYDATNVQIDPAESKDARRDDDPARRRAAVAVYARYDGAHRLGKSNNVGAGDIDGTEVYQGFDVDIRHGAPRSIGELAQIYITGPDDDDEDLPHQLAGAAARDAGRGKLYWRAPAMAGGAYPDVPWTTLVGELIEQVPPDGTRPDDPSVPADQRVYTRVYGRVNINTAPRQVLRRLPWPTFLDLNGNGTQEGGEPSISGADVDEIVDYILAYRMRGSIGSADYSNRGTTSGIPGLRDSSDHVGYLTPGELAVPLSDYVLTARAGSVPAVEEAGYLNAVNSLYTAVANVITTRSDTFAATIRVQVGDDTDESRNVWYYLAVYDRGNCFGPGHRPAVLLFSQVD
ncbi:MAG: hypothetical protein ACOC8F_07685, partial [Planctomycetota bacterium]